MLARYLVKFGSTSMEVVVMVMEVSTDVNRESGVCDCSVLVLVVLPRGSVQQLSAQTTTCSPWRDVDGRAVRFS